MAAGNPKIAFSATSPPPPSKNSYSYELLGEISRGTHGVVYRAKDMKTGQMVALKHQVHGICPSTNREVYVLSSLPRHPSVVQLKNLFEDSGRLFMAMEYLPNDLDRLIRSMKSSKRHFNMTQVKRMSKELLQVVSFLHENGVMHRDLKPSNILVDPEKGEFKICDFGLSRTFDRDEPSGSYTPHLGTSWYKAPEMLLGAKSYSCAVDMWSVGCIISELVLGETLFQGGYEIIQIANMFNLLGTPNQVSWPDFFNLAGDEILGMFEPQPYNKLRIKFSNAIFTGSPFLSNCGFDLVDKLLTYDPCKRISAREALHHPWFTEPDHCLR